MWCYFAPRLVGGVESEPQHNYDGTSLLLRRPFGQNEGSEMCQSQGLPF